MCTAFYSCRLAFLVFLNKPNGFKKYIEHAHEPSLFMMIPLFTLAFGSIFAGFFFKEFFLGLGSPSFGNSIFVAFDATILDAEFLNSFVKNIPFFFYNCRILIEFFDDILSSSFKIDNLI
jgi:NADH:ubiquinone oxidoreductase subunit 5 (subunit L)/multisubunit Na+/H+ antiporter MnhA subunit